MQLVSINDAAEIIGKSAQTIRRLIKKRELTVKKQKTPQGFNYLVVKDSLYDLMLAENAEKVLTSQKNSEMAKSEIPTSRPPNQTSSVADDLDRREPIDGLLQREHRAIEGDFPEKFGEQFSQLASTIQKLADQNSRDKENFFGLIRTFQDRILTLESHIKLLEAPRPKWWQFWRSQ